MQKVLLPFFMSIVLVSALVFPNPPAIAVNEGIVLPETFEAIAKVQVQKIEHSLRSSDIRRVENGAPPPIVPYKAYLTVKRTYPKIDLYRLTLEGIAVTTWMPQEEDEGILLVVNTGKAYEPSGAFPMDGFLLQKNEGDKQRVVFPPQSECMVPLALMWECLSDLIDMKKAGTAVPGTIEKWRRVLQDNLPEEAIIALYFLLNSPGDHIVWSTLESRLSPASGPAMLLDPAATLVSHHVAAASAGVALDTVMKALSGKATPTAVENLAQACIAIACRAPEAERVFLFEGLFSFEYGASGNKQGITDTFKAIEPVLARFGTEAEEQLLVRMLREPSRFAPIRKMEDRAAYWKFLSSRANPELPGYLRDFLKTPETFTGLPSGAPALVSLIRTAEELLAAGSASGQS